MPERVSAVPTDEILEKTLLGLLADREEAARLVAESPVFKVGSGETLVKAGRVASDLMIVVSGAARLEAAGSGGDTVELAGSVQAYEPINLLSVLDNVPHPFSAIADGETTVLILPRKKILPALEKTPGLLAYLRNLAQSSALKQLADNLDDLGCSKAFQARLIGAMAQAKVPGDSWVAREGEVPSFAFLMVAGRVQAFKKITAQSLKALWAVPPGTWQLWKACAEGAALAHSLKAVGDAELFKLDRAAIAALKADLPEEFEKFLPMVELASAKPKEEAEEEEQEVEKLEDLFPPHPRSVPSLRFQFPFIQQNDEMDCAPACLAMLSRFYGNDIPIQYWRERMGTDKEGTSLFDIAMAAEKAGFVAHGLALPDLTEVGPSLFPFIALRAYHYLVIYKLSGSTLTVGDPAYGIRKMSLKEFAEGYEGYAVLLRPTETFYHQKAAERGSVHYHEMLKGHEREMAIILLCSLLLIVLSLAPPLLSQFILDEVLAKKDPRLLAIVLGGAVLITGMISLTSWLRSYFLTYLTSKFDFASSSAFMRKLFSLPYEFFATRHVGDFTRRLAELERVRSFLTDELIGILLDVLNLGIYTVVLFLYSPTIALTTLIASPSLILLALLFSRRLQRLFGESFSARSDQESLVTDLIKGMSTIKCIGGELAARWRFEEALVRTLKVRYSFAQTAATMGGLNSFINEAVRFGMVGLAAYLAIDGGLTPGQVISASLMVSQVMGPFQRLAGAWGQFQEIRTVMDRLNDVFLAESESRPEARALVKKRLRGEIEFRDVWFRYGGESSDWVLKGMSFHILPGQSVAVVGPSGAGKSTLALLVARLYEAQKGSILIDGVDVRDYDRQWLRTQVGLLLQETNLFFGSVTANIAYADARPDFMKVQTAAKMAHAHDFISAKNGGYGYRITHGGMGLSGGEKQRISIARTIYCDPAILFLDEATSALDATAEKAVTDNLKGEVGRRTVISIAHRYSTVKASDYAMVVANGVVEEFGTHEELLAKGGSYAALFAGQIDA